LKVTITAQDGKTTTWNLPYALLKHHSGYFRRMEKFQEGQEGSVELQDQEPKIFGYFVEFLYFGHYTLLHGSCDVNGIRDDAKAWVLGDYLDAIDFKDCAIRNLYATYFPNGYDYKVQIYATTIDYCCSNSMPDSLLRTFYRTVAMRY
jgi:hypothetical protein